jgi:hypothetical protein
MFDPRSLLAKRGRKDKQDDRRRRLAWVPVKKSFANPSGIDADGDA